MKVDVKDAIANGKLLASPATARLFYEVQGFLEKHKECFGEYKGEGLHPNLNYFAVCLTVEILCEEEEFLTDQDDECIEIRKAFSFELECDIVEWTVEKEKEYREHKLDSIEEL